MSKHNFVISEPKSSNFSVLNVEWIVVKNAINRLSIPLFVLEIFVLKVKKLSENTCTVDDG